MSATAARILVVDDDHALARTLNWVLTENGYDVSALPSGDLLFDRLAEDSFDLLLMDIAMPGTDGLVLLEQLKADQRYRDLPVLMLSSLPPEEATVRALGLGAADFLAKPFPIRDLLARVKARLRAGMELNQVRAAARSQAEMLQIIREITATLSPEEIFQVLVRRVAQGLRISRCSILLESPEPSSALVVAAYENPMLRELPVDLRKYPEVRQALMTGEPVLAAGADTDPLYSVARMEWEEEGRQVPTTSAAVLPFRLANQRKGVFFLRTTGADPVLNRQDMDFAGQVINTAVSTLEKAYAHQEARLQGEEFRQLAETDPLTGLVNRRVLAERLNSEADSAMRLGTPLSCLVVDVDRFKQLNDSYGHPVGDMILVQLSELFQDERRGTDVVARFGGEEFVILLPETALQGAQIFSQRLLERIAANRFGPPDRPIRITVSIGIAALPDPDIPDSTALLARADERLLQAKAEGRNRYRA